MGIKIKSILSLLYLLICVPYFGFLVLYLFNHNDKCLNESTKIKKLNSCIYILIMRNKVLLKYKFYIELNC